MGRFLRRLQKRSTHPARAAGVVLALLVGLAGLLAAVAAGNPAGESDAAGEAGVVVRAVDGDTLVVRIGGREERVRLLGVDTPESVHPRKPVEYFGKEASAFTSRLTTGKRVRLAADPSNTDRDRYGRLLRYVILPDGTLLNAVIIEQGYGHAYTRYPFGKMEEFRALERKAREAGRGLWAPGHAPDGAVPLATASVGAAGGAEGDSAAPAWPEGKPDDIVYVTRTGTKYHADGCPSLRRSRIPVKLRDAVGRKYQPCSICRPPRLPSRSASGGDDGGDGGDGREGGSRD